MPPLPVVSGRAVVRAFAKDGWTPVRTNGDHMILTKPGKRATLSVPDHRELAPGTLRGLLRAADISVAGFLELLG